MNNPCLGRIMQFDKAAQDGQKLFWIGKQTQLVWIHITRSANSATLLHNIWKRMRKHSGSSSRYVKDGGLRPFGIITRIVNEGLKRTSFHGPINFHHLLFVVEIALFIFIYFFLVSSACHFENWQIWLIDVVDDSQKKIFTASSRQSDTSHVFICILCGSVN